MAQKFVGFGIVRVHAQGSASLGNGIFGVSRAVEETREPAVGLGKIGHETRRLGELVERFIPLLLPFQ